jgi:TPR repeat protein
VREPKLGVRTLALPDLLIFLFHSLLSLLALACERAPVDVAPRAPLPPACPVEGCGGERAARIASEHAPDACPGAGEAPCAGASASECASRALAAWSDAQDENEVACVARKLTEACSLGEAPACGYAGRMWLDGRGVASDPDRGLAMVLRACEGGVVLACTAGLRWLAEARREQAVKEGPALHRRLDDERSCLMGGADRCMELGLALYAGAAPYPRDLARSAVEYQRGCDLGSGLACSNLGDACEYGSGVPRDLSRAAALYERACRLGKALGCSNLGHLLKHGEGVARDVGRARALFRDACTGGDLYGCLHAALLVAEEGGAPRDPPRSVEHWQRACDARDARACAFVGLLFEDGPDGYARDEARSQQAMSRACDLGNRDGCQWLRFHAGP